MASNDILDSWEDFTDFEAPRSGKTKKSRSQTDSGNESSSNIIVTEETHRTQYKPQIRILKREPQDDRRNANVDANNSNGSGSDSPGESKPKAKTLAQREAEYAEARRRILGPSYNPEEPPPGPPPPPPLLSTTVPPPLVPPFPPPLTSLPPPPSLADLVPPYPPPPILPHPSHVHPPPSQPPASHYDDQSPRRLAQRMENLKMNPGVMVVRQPNGPDPDGFRGFSGFKPHDMRR